MKYKFTSCRKVHFENLTIRKETIKTHSTLNYKQMYFFTLYPHSLNINSMNTDIYNTQWNEYIYDVKNIPCDLYCSCAHEKLLLFTKEQINDFIYLKNTVQVDNDAIKEFLDQLLIIDL